MIRRFAKYSVVGLVLVTVVCAVTIWVILGTQWGTQRLVAWVQPTLPKSLSIGSIQGTVLGGLVLRDARWVDDGQRVSVDYALANAEFLPLVSRSVVLKTLNIQGVVVLLPGREPETAKPKTTFEFEPLPINLVIRYGVLQNVSLDLAGSRYAIEKVTLQGELRDMEMNLDRLLLEGPWILLDMQGTAELAEPFESELDARWSVDVDDAVYAGTLKAQGDWSSLQIDHSLTSPLTVTSEGTVNAIEKRFNLVHQFPSQDVPGVDGYRFGPGTLFTGGVLPNMEFELQSDLDPGDLSQALLEAKGTVQYNTVEFNSFKLTSDQGGLYGQGNVSWANDVIGWDGSLSGDGLDLRLLEPSLVGHVSLSLDTAGQYSSKRDPNAWIQLTEVDGTLNQLPITGGGRIQLDGGNILAEAVSLSSGDNTVQIDGILNQSLLADVELRNLVALNENLAGSVVGTVTISGGIDDWLIQPNLKATAVNVGELSLAEGQLTSDTTGQQHHLTMRGLNLGTAEIDTAEVTVTGSLREHQVESTLAMAQNSASFSLSGGRSAEGWQGTLEAAQLEFGNEQTWNLEEAVNLVAEKERQGVDGFCFLGPDTARVCGLLENQTPKQVAQMNLDVRDVPLFQVMNDLRPDVEGKGLVSGEIALTQTSLGYSGEALLRSSGGQLKFVTEDTQTADLPFSLEWVATLSNNQLQSSGLLNLGQEGELSATLGIADLSSSSASWQGDVMLAVEDLSFLSLLVPDIRVSAGRLNGQLNIGGTRDQPAIEAKAEIISGEAYLEQTGSTFSDIQLVLNSNGAVGRYAITGKALSDDGQVTIQGYVDGALGWKTEVAVTGRDVSLVKLPDFQVDSHLNLDLGYDNGGLTVDGEVVLPKAFIALEELPENAVTPSGDTIVHSDTKTTSEMLPFRLALDVSVEEDVHLKGFGLDSNLVGVLNLKADQQSTLSGTGTLNLVNGKFDAYGQELEITQGSLIFTGPLNNPILDIRAVRQVGETTVGVQISGTASRPQSSLFSNPSLSDADALAYLITGRPIEQTGNREGGELLSAALALGVSKNLATEIRSTLGLDELTVTGTGEDGQVLAGKRLGNRLYLQYAFGIFDNIGNVLLRYTLTDRLTFESESGEEQSLDLFYSVKKQ